MASSENQKPRMGRPPVDDPLAKVSFRLRGKTLRRIEKDAEKSGVTPSEFIRYLCEYYAGDTTARAP